MKYQELLQKMTFSEKAALLTGEESMLTAGIDRLGVPRRLLSDGPHGVRMREADNSTHFPNLCCVGASWDVEMIARMGAAIAQECILNGVSMILGPGINVKRHILCGRNFEYISEDPRLSGEMGAGYIRGVQEKGVAVSLKHYAANSQEAYRLDLNAEIDERTLREIYLRGFEIAVKRSAPESVMCAYNKINALWCSENPMLLKETLKEEWGFEGFVVSDWGAVQDVVRAVGAGLDLIMPPEAGVVEKLEAAVADGRLTMAQIDEAADRVLRFLMKRRPCKPGVYDRAAQHAVAREIAASGIVLLKNKRDALPLTDAKYHRIAVVGEYAREPLICGQGSAEVYNDPQWVDSPLQELRRLLPGCEIKYYPGCSKEAYPREMLWPTMGQYGAFIEDCDAAVLFIGSMLSEDTENFDRRTAALNPNFDLFINKACTLGKKVIVVMQTGSAVILGDWRHRVDGLVEMWLGGEAAGGAVADVLCGRVNPSGKLTETFPTCMRRDLNYPGENNILEYNEKLNVGYRYYDRHPEEICYPFGHGLSYTSFAYSDIQLALQGDTFSVTFMLENTGSCDGGEVVQVYASDPVSTVTRPVKELIAFRKVFLKAGEKQQICIPFTAGELAYYNTSLHAWVTESGEYRILVGASSQDIRLEASVLYRAEMPYTTSAVNETMIG